MTKSDQEREFEKFLVELIKEYDIGLHSVKTVSDQKKLRKGIIKRFATIHHKIITQQFKEVREEAEEIHADEVKEYCKDYLSMTELDKIILLKQQRQEIVKMLEGMKVNRYEINGVDGFCKADELEAEVKKAIQKIKEMK